MALPRLGTVKYHVTIPSSGETIEFRPYTVKEEKALLIAMESKDQLSQVAAARDLVSSCTMGNINVDEIAMFDFEYLFLQIRSKSVGETSTIRIKCSNEECGTPLDVIVDLDQVQVQGEVRPSTKVMLTDDVGVMVSYPKVKGVIKQLMKGKKSASDYESTLNIIASCIDSIFDADNVYDAADQSPKELMEFVESLSSSQFKHILELFKELPTLKHKEEMTCKKCGTTTPVVLEGLQSFF